MLAWTMLRGDWDGSVFLALVLAYLLMVGRHIWRFGHGVPVPAQTPLPMRLVTWAIMGMLFVMVLSRV